MWPRVRRVLYHDFDVALVREDFVDHALACALVHSGWPLDPSLPVATRTPRGEWGLSGFQRGALAAHASLGNVSAVSLGNLSSRWRGSPDPDAAAVSGRTSSCPAGLRVCGCTVHQAARAWRHVES